MSEADIESEIRRKGLNAPRITPQMIDETIVSTNVFTAADGVYAADGSSGTGTPLHLLTICVLVLRNGFTVTGESACASPENFDPKIGAKLAIEDARNKVWMLEGYLLKDRLYHGA